ncbi:MAG TPA: MYXO-CTERM sorting domain-containing protein [Polyangia bacterium]|jgi:MYXO-CTERM domain-containing protein
MTRRRLAAALALVALAAAASALGYVRSRTAKSNTPLAWHGSCAFLTPDSAGTPDVPTAAVLAAIDASVQTWTTTGCSYFDLRVDPSEPNGSAILDRPQGKNFIVFRRDAWCPPDPSEPCYDANATALTTVFYVDKPGAADDGRILDADVEMNNVDFGFTVDGTPPPTHYQSGVADLENTLTHELGHLLGLDHTCYDGWNKCEDGFCKVNHLACRANTDDCNPVDENGTKIPNCGPDLPASVVQATMFNYASPGDTSKRTLSQDDINGLCAMYPLAADPKSCSRVDTSSDSGCRAAPGAAASPALLLLLLAALALARRRR